MFIEYQSVDDAMTACDMVEQPDVANTDMTLAYLFPLYILSTITNQSNIATWPQSFGLLSIGRAATLHPVDVPPLLNQYSIMKSSIVEVLVSLWLRLYRSTCRGFS